MSSFILFALAGLICAAILLCAVYWHWRVYALYRSLDDVRDRFAYTEFSFQFGRPWSSRQLGGPMFRNGLSPHQEMRVQAVMQQLRPAIVVYRICALVLFVAIVAGFLR
jgi:hypothetical protein